MTDEEIEKALASLNLSKETYEAYGIHADDPQSADTNKTEATAETEPAEAEQSESGEPYVREQSAEVYEAQEAAAASDAGTESADIAPSEVVNAAETENAGAEATEAGNGVADAILSDAAMTDISATEIDGMGLVDITQPQKPKEKKRLFNFSTKLLLLCILPMALVCVITVAISSGAMRSSIETEVQKSLKIVAVTMEETYINLYEGDYHKSKDGAVYKGEKKISGDNKLLKSFEEKTSFKTTLIWGDMRLITTVKNEKGAAATGTKLDKELCAQIEDGEGQEVFIEGTDIFGTDFYVYYMPLKNADGSIIGAIEVMIETDSVNAIINAQIVKLVSISLLIMAAVAALILLISRTMVATMTQTKEFLGRIADGELTVEPDTKLLSRDDELGDIYSMSVRLQTELRKIVNNIKDSVEDLTSSANQLTEMAQETKGSVENVLDAVEGISKGTVTQAEGTTTANHNVDQIGQQIDYITDEVNSLTKHARQMSEAEKRSELIIVELNASSENTKDSVLKVSDQIGIMNKSIQSIRSAVELIQAIADETDLLSLNASIEAARAGEAGRGFAVVAEQICKLAEQSNRSAEKIEKIIAEVMNESDRMVEIMGEVSDNMDHQQAKLEETKTTYQAVAEGVEKSLGNIDQIKDQMGVLNHSGDEIKSVVEDLAVISDQNAASVQSTMGSAESMSATMNRLERSSEKLLHLADSLNEALEIFKI